MSAPRNQCDGCAAGYPRHWRDSGILGHSGAFYHEYPEGVWHGMECQAHRYVTDERTAHSALDAKYEAQRKHDDDALDYVDYSP